MSTRGAGTAVSLPAASRASRSPAPPPISSRPGASLRTPGARSRRPRLRPTITNGVTRETGPSGSMRCGRAARSYLRNFPARRCAASAASPSTATSLRRATITVRTSTPHKQKAGRGEMNGDIIPKNLDSLHDAEEQLRQKAHGIIAADTRLHLHLAVTEAAMDLADMLRQFNSSDENLKVVTVLGMRTFNAFAATIKLMLSGYHQ